MGVVTAKRLNDYMSSPEWTPEQVSAVEDVLAGLERELEGALFGAWITPRPTFEVAPILRSGLVATTQVVHAVTAINGTTVDGTHPLAPPWVVRDHRLRTMTPGAVPVLTPFSLSAPTAWDAGRAGATDAVGSVSVEYEGGWGADPAIVLAILRKASNWALNWTEDSIRIRETDGTTPPPLTEEWTAEELAGLSAYRNITAVRGRRR